ncbi:16S rRNA (guanine(527)-N(7))-methyltransferase RsmG [Chryseosolibacter indicus]|uniref:Ribosomal RNA small subunit methyltransferase G n=1 Tax=Chryseosolibacter indicus TaxID=2782351 RepID=A0ABS5VL34_9BACT|nr:16S rRNA (guanine(527)-N(7))-methyltransferase RsmG [Chryseosolibacter indicus]
MHSADLVFSYFPNLSIQQQEQFKKLFALYSEWNDKINVISRKDIENLYINHVLHSLGIAKVMAFKPGAHVLDVGTGGGFPGIPLAILFPETKFHLVDSIGKKITVVKNVAEGINLKNVHAEQIRAEQVKGEYDFIVSRAVTRIKEFYQWIHQKVKKKSVHDLDNGILYLKGGDLEEELNELKKPYQLFDLPQYFKEEFFETKKVVYVPL